MSTKFWAIGLVVLCTAFTSLAQLSYKHGLNNIPFLNLSALTNVYSLYVLLGLALYGMGAALLITALKKGEVTLLYPIVATSYIWVSLLSMFFLKEAMNLYKWLGVVVIVLGIIIIASGSREKETIELASEVV